ncbi:hypothetical protein HK101_005238 [Irineochytrium annulatum]|nr:hypothetical protein HK101_005238 [Irineochytrium annulatum]
MGAYLGLTGRPLTGVEGVQAGLATHRVAGGMDAVEALVRRLVGLGTSDLRHVDVGVEAFSGDAPSVEDWDGWSLGGELLEAVRRCFAGGSLEAVVRSLEAENSLWSTETLAFLHLRPPSVLEVTLEAVRRGRKLDLASCLRMERLAALRLLSTQDVRASLAAAVSGGPQPKWEPTLEDHMNKHGKKRKDFVSLFFNPPSEVESQRLLDTAPPPDLKVLQRTYTEYPHRTVTGLPTEEDVRKVVTGEAWGSGELALTERDAVTFLRDIWGGFLDPVSLAPLEAPPARNGKNKGEFFPGKFMRVEEEDPSAPATRFGIRRESWGLRQRVANVIRRRCDVKDGYLSWRG